MKHKWSEKTCLPNGDSRKVCTREGCEIVCLSCHDVDDHGRQQHFKRWYRGTEFLRRDGSVPACEAVATSPSDAREVLADA